MAQIGPDGKAAALSGEPRAAWLARAKKWVDLSPVLGVTILMHNQGALTDDSKAGVTSLWKELQDYATPKGVKISGETRGSGVPTAGNRGQGGAPAAPPPAAPAMSEKERLRYVWGILWESTVKQRRLHEPRLRRRHPIPQPAGAARRDQGPAAAQQRRHAHACQSDVGSGYGDQIRRVDRLQGQCTPSRSTTTRRSGSSTTRSSRIWRNRSEKNGRRDSSRRPDRRLWPPAGRPQAEPPPTAVSFIGVRPGLYVA